ncbi:flagellar protein FliS [Tibeticola sediminis]|jgi:flagellar protein FliS|uniref:Flagellar protein FliS n=1 Tax=Tibeticola sediminis TaxID=1917811 RepID=A0A3N4USZ1_9BURK|nr:MULTISPECIES: flagellar export chaperone FliS [Tibeticola]MCI4440290.1 flagellar export chaperone FliS [Tibeticola sp.]RPE70569.1 flagellar protein FliS [Tibeticola sediminis]
MSAGLAVAAYRQVDKTGVPEEKLLVLGLDGILEYLRRARLALVEGAVERKLQSLNRAYQLVEHLLAALPEGNGPDGEGALNRRLAGIYRYLLERLAHANIFDDLEAVDDCSAVVTALRDSWIESLRQH